MLKELKEDAEKVKKMEMSKKKYKTWKEILELKSITERKNSLDRFKGRFK